MKQKLSLVGFVAIAVACALIPNRSNAGNAEERQLETPPVSTGIDERLSFYMNRLADSSYVGTYGDAENVHTWYAAAEELGRIGAPALAPLIERVVTTRNEYERRLGIYALRLAAQDPLIRLELRIAMPEYPQALPAPDEQPRIVGLWVQWWLTHRSVIEAAIRQDD